MNARQTPPAATRANLMSGADYRESLRRLRIDWDHVVATLTAP